MQTEILEFEGRYGRKTIPPRYATRWMRTPEEAESAPFAYEWDEKTLTYNDFNPPADQENFS